MKSLRGLLVAAVVVFGFPVLSEAGSITCPGAASRSFTLTLPGAPTATCAHSGDGANDINGDADDFYTPEWDAWDKDFDGTTAVDETAVTDLWFTFTIDPTDDSDGSFTLLPAAWDAYDQIIIAFKVGSPGPRWASFFLPSGWFGTGTIDVDPAQGSGISHVTLYGLLGPDDREITETPEPAALALFGSGLALLAFRLRRRNEASRS